MSTCRARVLAYIYIRLYVKRVLTELFIRNLTLIDEMSLSFGPGLTVLTGETGAGKSILLDAIFLAIGGRASSDQIRDGAAELDVTARFGLEEPTLLLRRVVARNGRHRQYINAMPVTVGQLREVAEPLVDFTGQHAQHALLFAKGQMSLLDAYADHDHLLSEVTTFFEARKELLAEKARLSLDERSRANRVEWLRYQLDEIDKCGLKSGELEELANERERLLNAAKIKEEGARILRALSDGDQGDDVLSRLALVLRSIQYFAAIESRLEDASNLIDDACREVTKQIHSLEEDSGRLSEVEDRIGDIKQLTRKHGDTIEEVFGAANKMRTELASLEAHDESLATIEKKLRDADTKLGTAASALSKSRRDAAVSLAPLVRREIADLGMPEAQFAIELTSQDEVHSTGADTLRMLFSANPGESPNALEKAASGGELSRVMLGIKRVLMTKDTTMVSIFDEVDAGVGGAIGHAIGEKLKAISKGRQVLCVTHLAQVAALADAHLKVEKKVVAGRTISTLQTLTREQRVEELARMMGGKEVTDLTRKHAHEFLQQAGVAQ